MIGVTRGETSQRPTLLVCNGLSGLCVLLGNTHKPAECNETAAGGHAARPRRIARRSLRRRASPWPRTNPRALPAPVVTLRNEHLGAAEPQYLFALSPVPPHGRLVDGALRPFLPQPNQDPMRRVPLFVWRLPVFLYCRIWSSRSFSGPSRGCSRAGQRLPH